MTTIAPSTLPLTGVNGAKRKFFQRHDPYVKYYHPRNEASDNGSTRKNGSSSTCTAYGSALSPPYRNKKYFVACTSNGCIAVWDPRPCSARQSSHDVDSEDSGSFSPVVIVRVDGETGSNNQILYDLRFIQTNSGDHFLVASGDPGIIIYKWCDFEAVIDAREGGDTRSKKSICQDPLRIESSSRPPFAELRPVTTFKPHPSPVSSFGGSVEINSSSYSKSDGILFGAAGDVFGCYQWDLATEKLLGTFGGASRFDCGGHHDYLHVVKAIPAKECIGSRYYVITGGEDGKMGFWDGKDRKLIEMMNVQSTMDKNKDSVASNTTTNNRIFTSNSATTWNNGSNLWVSSMDMNGNWLAVSGGAENTNNTITSRSGPSSAGFMTLWHLPTRTFTAGCVTRECVNTVVYNSSLDCLVSGGNEGRVSFWEPTTMTRSGRSWSTPPATYTISVDSESMVVGGSGCILDYFVDRVKVAPLAIPATAIKTTGINTLNKLM